MEDEGFLKKVVGCCSGISYTYRDYIDQYPSLADLDGPAIGDRAPDVNMESGQSLFSIIGDTCYTLLLSQEDATVVEIAEKYSAIIKVHALNNSAAFNDCYSVTGEAVVYLVRPDGYIGFRCLASEAEHLDRFLANITSAD